MRTPIFFCFVCAAALAALPQLKAETAATALFRQGSFVILPVADAPTLQKQCSRSSPGPVSGTWVPTLEQVAALEPPLFELLSKSLSGLEWGSAKPLANDYYRQYVGLIIGKRHIIYVNGIHKSSIDEEKLPWRNTPVTVCDGGPYFFGAEYDAASKTFNNFSFNGMP